MPDHTYKSLELTGTSKTSIEEAVNNALVRASKTVHNLRWFEVVDLRGHIEKGKVAHWQVTFKVGFALDE